MAGISGKPRAGLEMHNDPRKVIPFGSLQIFGRDV
jgi:hypothetical protein